MPQQPVETVPSHLPYIETVTAQVKGLNRTVRLGPLTVITGRPASGKTSLINAIEVALGETPSEVIGRVEAGAAYLGAALIPRGANEAFIDILFDEGTEVAAHIRKGKKTIEVSRNAPDRLWLPISGALPVRDAWRAVTGSADTALDHFVSAGQGLTPKAACEPFKALLGALPDFVPPRVEGTGGEYLKVLGAKLEEWKRGLDQQALRCERAAAVPEVTEEELAEAEQGSTGQSAPDHSALVAAWFAAMKAVHAAEDALAASLTQEPSRVEGLKLLEHSRNAIEEHLALEAARCLVCGHRGDPGRFLMQQAQVDAALEESRAADVEWADWDGECSTVQGDLEVARGTLLQASAACAAVGLKDPKAIAAYRAPSVTVRPTGDIRALRAGRTRWLDYNSKINEGKTLRAQGAQVQEVIREVDKRIRALSTGGLDPLIARARPYLHPDETLEILDELGGMRAFVPMLKAPGVSAVGPSGHQTARVLLALGAATARPEAYACLIPPDHGLRKAELIAWMEDIARATPVHQVIIATTVHPGPVPGWAIVDLDQKV